jgi:hypothetical protein
VNKFLCTTEGTERHRETIVALFSVISVSSVVKRLGHTSYDYACLMAG